jgi:hypothetical protein
MLSFAVAVTHNAGQLANLCGVSYTELLDVMCSLGIRIVDGRVEDVEARQIVSKLITRQSSEPERVDQLRCVMAALAASRIGLAD